MAIVEETRRSGRNSEECILRGAVDLVGVLVFGLFVRNHDVLDCDVLSRIPYHIRYLNMVCNRSGDGGKWGETGER